MKNIKLVSKAIKSQKEELEVKNQDQDIKVEIVGALEDGNVEEFNGLIKDVYEKVVSAKDFGGWTEYYDEDGLVLMTTQQEDANTVLFDFGTGEEFKFNQEGFVMPSFQ